MVLNNKIILTVLGVCVSVGLSACGSDSDGDTNNGLAGLGGNDSVADVGQSSAATDDQAQSDNSDSEARTIVLTYPITDSIENLGGGVYRRIGKAIVTDSDGAPVADGTQVHFRVIDSIMAKGTISSAEGDSINGAVLTDNNATLADGMITTLDTAYVIRNEAFHFIRAGDHVLLKADSSSNNANNVANAEPEDKNRVIDSEQGSVAGNSVTLTREYSRAYPNAVYASGETDYVIGASLLGAKIFGVQTNADGSGSNVGFATTSDGIAEFYVTYPANNREINSGCVPANIDERALPLGSAQVVLVASAGTQAITLDDRFCFEPVAPYVLSHEPDLDLFPGSAFTGAEVAITLEDANGVRIPYEPVKAYTTTDSAELSITEVTFTSPHTERDGTVSVLISAEATADAESGDTARITIRSGDASTEITVSVI